MERKKNYNTPYDGGWWVTDGGWCVTDGGWCVTDGGWWVTDGGWWVTDGGWWVTDGGWWVTDGGWCVTDGGWWVTDGGWWVTDGGWWVTDGGWWVTDGGWWVTDGGWWVTDGGWWVATKHQRVDAIAKKKGGEPPYGTPWSCSGAHGAWTGAQYRYRTPPPRHNHRLCLVPQALALPHTPALDCAHACKCPGRWSLWGCSLPFAGPPPQGRYPAAVSQAGPYCTMDVSEHSPNPLSTAPSADACTLHTVGCPEKKDPFKKNCETPAANLASFLHRCLCGGRHSNKKAFPRVFRLVAFAHVVLTLSSATVHSNTSTWKCAHQTHAHAASCALPGAHPHML